MFANRYVYSQLCAAALIALLASPPAASQGRFATVAAEIDDDSGYLVFSSFGGEWTSATSWDLSVSRSDTSTTLSDFRTTSLAGSVYHDFGAYGFRLGLGGWRDEGLARIDRLSASFDRHGPAWSIAVDGEVKRSDFDPFVVDRVVERRDGTLVTIAGTADCAVDAVGLGARLSYTGNTWSLGLSGMSFDYDDFGCDFDLLALDLLRNATRDEFVQLADRVTDVLAIGSARHLLAETSFLDTRIGISAWRDTAARSYRVNYDRVEDAFFGRTADTLSAGIGFPLRAGSELEVYAGITSSDGISDIGFVGLLLLLDW